MDTSSKIAVGHMYRHFKGDVYLVEGLAEHTESGETMVIYRALYGDNQLYCRPARMWDEVINKNGQKCRFERYIRPSVRTDK